MPSRLTIVAVAAVLAVAGLATALVAGRATDRGSSAGRQTTTAGSRGGSIAAGDRVPTPSGKTVLRISGVRSGNVRAHLTALDLRTLDQFPHVDVRIYEPFVKKQVTFRGVPVSDLFAIVGIPGGGSLYMHALDDYHVTLDQAKLVASHALIATRADGKRLPLKGGGPIRLVFPGDDELAANTDNWIWSIDRILVKR